MDNTIQISHAMMEKNWKRAATSQENYTKQNGIDVLNY
jgi:hypothetical protein